MTESSPCIEYRNSLQKLIGMTLFWLSRFDREAVFDVINQLPSLIAKFLFGRRACTRNFGPTHHSAVRRDKLMLWHEVVLVMLFRRVRQIR